MQKIKHLFFIFILTLVFVPSAKGVDFNCSGGKWVVVGDSMNGTGWCNMTSVGQRVYSTQIYICEITTVRLKFSIPNLRRG